MSNTNNTSNNIPIVPITIPELTSVEYATGLSDAFDNINSNFATLANHEFVKGDPGKSVKIQAENVSEYKDIITNAIINAYDLSGVTIQDNIWQNIDNNNETIYMIYNTDNAVLNDEEPISSLYYVFIDGRYNLIRNNEIDFNEIPDLSCIVVYKPNNDGTPNFEVLKNQFPTIYYELGVGLCWKINGSNTGLPVRGLTGKDGINASMQIVRCDSFESAGVDNSLIGKIVGVYDIYNGYITLDDETKATFIENHENQSAIILSTDMTGINNGFYFGVIDVDADGNPIAKTDQRCSITNGFDTQVVIDAMRSIDLLDKGNNNGSSGIKGLFIPIKNNDPNNTNDNSQPQPVHLLSATSITNTKGNASSDKNDVILTPINDIVNLDVTNDKKLQVDKYLLLDVIKDSSITKNFASDYNYLLRYKLVNKITTIDALGVDETTQLPSLFRDALSASGNGIYKWQLDDAYINNNSYNDFKFIYTLTLNPSFLSEIMWYGYIDEDLKEKSWFGNNIDNDNYGAIFSFNKFVPVFVNAFSYTDDTALNINYNINITGKENESRNVTVKGAVNCDDLYVYNLSAAGEIKNIYTKDNIVGEKGLQLGNETTGYVEIKHGGINAENEIATKDITCETIKSNTITSNNINSDEAHVGNMDIANDNINIHDTKNIVINRPNNDNNDNVEQHILSTNMSTIQYKNSNTIITNSTINNKNLCIYGSEANAGDKNSTTGELEYEVGEGVTGTLDKNVSKISNLEFDYVKNFNINRLYANKQAPIKLSVKKIGSLSVYTRNLLTDNLMYTQNESYYNYTDERTCNFNLDDLDESTNINNILNELNNRSICKFELSNNDATVNKMLENDIKIEFLNKFNFQIGLYSRCHYGKWPSFIGNKSSLTLKLAYIVKYKSGQKIEKYFDKSWYRTIKFDKSNSSFEYYGYNTSGTLMTGDNNYSGRWRYYSCDLCIKDIILNSTDTIHKKLVENYNNTNIDTIILYVYPEFSLYFKGDNKTIKCARVSKIIQNKASSTNNNSLKIITDKYVQWKYYDYCNDNSYYPTIYFDFIDYSVNALVNDNFKSTTLCNNGIVIRDGNTVFGIGYGKSILNPTYDKLSDDLSWSSKNGIDDKPMLFYHHYNAGYYNEYGQLKVDIDDNTTRDGYARRMNAIPLEDIFSVIKYVRSKTDWEFGV